MQQFKQQFLEPTGRLAKQSMNKFIDWASQEQHKQKARELREEIHRAFTEHPEQTGETYLEHLWFTIKFAVNFVFVSIVLLTHGILPFMFKRTASKQIMRVYIIMKKRIPKISRENFDDYDI